MASTLANHADRLNLRHAAYGRLPPLILVTDRARLPDPVAALDRQRPGDAVLLRDYDAPARAMLAATLARHCRARRLRLLVAGDARLAHAVGADGVHLPENMVSRAPAIRSTHPRFLITVAAHDAGALVAAARGGADAALLSPVFATASHPGAPFLGVVRFAALVRDAKLPVYALGGIGGTTAARLTGTGAVGLAAIGAFAA
jgi:thiamine-phosphate pyrophosphorylase